MSNLSSRGSAAALLSAATLAVSSADAAPVTMALDAVKQGGTNVFTLKVELAKTQAASLNLQFSDNLRTWASADSCGCLQPIGSEVVTNDQSRLRSLFHFTPSATNSQRFIRAMVLANTNIVTRLSGLDVSPYFAPGEDASLNVTNQINREELYQRLQRVAPYTDWVRSFGTGPDLKPFGSMAHQLGLRAAVTAWLGTDAAENQRQIDTLVELSIKGDVDLAIVGSETLLRGDVSASQLVTYINDVRTRLRNGGISIPVATSDVYGSLMAQPSVISACDVILPNIYPYWEGRGVDCAVSYLNRSYQQLVAVSGGKPIIISETGWPTCGDRLGEAIPSPANAAQYLHTFISWAKANNIEYWAFSTFDEAWKTRSEGPQGGCWGIWDSNMNLKPGMEVLFSGVYLSPDHWLTCSSDPVINVFTSPDAVTTNLRKYLISGAVNPGETVRLNGTPLGASQTNALGDFAAIVDLANGTNTLHIDVYPTNSATPRLSATKIVRYDPAFSTAGKRLLYVDIVDDAGATPSAPGTAVIDLDGNAILGILPDRHVRAIAPGAGGEIYMQDLGVLSTAHHTDLRNLPFSSPIDTRGFAVTPNGAELLYGSEVVEVASNQLRPAPLPANLATGGSWAGAPIPGGPAVSPDGKSVFFGNNVSVIDLASNTLRSTGFSANFLSDITVSPDNRVVAVSGYSYGNGHVDFYNATNFAFLGSATGLGDFAGQVEFVGNRAVAGTCGNPANGGGYLSVIDTNNMQVLGQLNMPLADNLAVSERGEIFVAAGLASDGVQQSKQGVYVVMLSQSGTPLRVKSFHLGVNRWVPGTGRPQYDQIRAIVYKP